MVISLILFSISLLISKLWKFGIHDKRLLKIIKAMLKVGYIEQELQKITKAGVGQGSVISPLLANVYLNDFDWYVGRKYCQPKRHCKNHGHDTRRLRNLGVTPKYNIRFADNWVIMTSTECEAIRLKKELLTQLSYFQLKIN
jgi:retron-type reverse transcriptase